MSTEVNKAFVQQFSDNLIHLAQQKGSKLRGAVKTETVRGKYHHFDRLGLQAASKRTTRHGDTPITDTPHSRRRVQLDDYEVADLIDNQDKIRMLVDPASDYAMAMANALGRKMDDIIITAAVGNATSIDAADSSSNVALPAGQTIDEDFTTANSDLIFEKIVEAKRILMANDVDTDNEELFLVMDSTSHSVLLKETEVTSRDYTSDMVLENGRVARFLGFNIIVTNRLTAQPTSEGFVHALALTKSAIGLALGQDIEVRISERADKSYATQVYASMTMGATRIEDEKVVAIECYRA